MNVLLTSVGRRVALLRAFRRELAGGGRVLGADASRLSAGMQDADAAYVVPPCASPEYVPALLEIVRRERVDVVIPLIDPELGVLARDRELFQREGCLALVSDPDAVTLSRDKRRSVKRFRELGFDAPDVIAPDLLARPEALDYPLFLKPLDGSSSIGATPVEGPDDLRFHLAHVPHSVVQSLIPGEEFTVDVFADLEGRARCAVPRRRLEVRGGEISKGRTVKDPAIMAQASGLVEALGGCRGCITVQCFRTPDGRVVFFEANLRFGGGFPLSYAAGANYPGWILRLARGEPVAPFDGWQDGLVMLRYDDAVFAPGLV
ncbi:ATP-grasp domain-containing protein [Anaeromyxobacter paludicola]|uniref:Carbamoyl phosphate synthase n=1 Tax=Anaeromyxobacter paludicola TaxID=2918171 RepID=A0ABM7X9K0_9BACT|nr:ATP-grasp domain-containing protein [Anaeromyxobacter paludicola]BDG08529.1 carbamoyl phosphate synthase [Anaeromyxobacter paludicola]